jgi:transcriptional repressor NrdR
MRCPRCSHEDTAVIETRTVEEDRAIRRRRECQKCDYRFTTFERTEISSLIVVKRDDTREPFSREKLERGIWLACTKRPITKAQIDDMLTELETAWSSGSHEVESTRIGTDVMNALSAIDKVAYIRFASVHREFKDVEEFKEEVKKLFD